MYEILMQYTSCDMSLLNSSTDIITNENQRIFFWTHLWFIKKVCWACLDTEEKRIWNLALRSTH